MLVVTTWWMPHAASATSRPSGPATWPVDAPARPLDVEPHPAPEKVVGVEVAEDEVGVGDGGRGPAEAVADGPGRGARGVGADAQDAGLDARDRAPAGADLDQVDGLDVHRDAAPGLEPDPVQLELADGLRAAAGDQGELRGRPAHVEGDEVGVARELAVRRGHEGAGGRSGFDHAHGKAGHRLRGGDAAAGLHDEEPPAVVERPERLLEAPEVVAHRGHHVRVDDGRRGPLVLADDGRDLRREADRGPGRLLADDLGGAPLVRRVDVGVQEADGDRRDPVPAETPDGLAQAGLVERHEHLAVEGHPLGHLPDPRAGDQRGGLLDEEIVELVALLPADDQDVAEAPGRQEGDVPALSLDDDVRAERGPVHGLDEVGPAEPRAGDQLAEPLHARPGRVVRRREALAGEEAPVVGLEREVGEGPADVEADPEGHGLSVTGTSAACPARAGRRGRSLGHAVSDRARGPKGDRISRSCTTLGPVSEQSERRPFTMALAAGVLAGAGGLGRHGAGPGDRRGAGVAAAGPRPRR